MKLKQLSYLIKVMECGSLSEAARQMNVSQPNITRAISGLEKEYGISILNRKARGVEFTPDGKNFILYAKGVMAAVASYPKAGETPVVKARLFVASQQLDFLHPALLKTYQKFADRNIFFNIVETDRGSVSSRVLTGEVDLGLLVRTSADIDALLWQKAANRLQADVLTSGHPKVALGIHSPLWDRDSIRPEELNGYLQIALDMENEVKQNYWASTGHYENFNNNRVVFVNTVEACRRFLQTTDGYVYCSDWTSQCFSGPDMKVLPVRDYDVSQELLLIRRIGEKLSDAERTFVEEIGTALGQSFSGIVKG